MAILKASRRGLFLIVLVVFFVFLYKGLFLDHSSAFFEKENQIFPDFQLNDVRDHRQQLTLKEIKGKPCIVHVWATWCGICIKEHEQWLAIANQFNYPVIGMVYRDEANRVMHLLNKKGDPYTYLLDDVSGKLGLDLGIIGTPETYILDSKGVIRYHYLGAVDVKTFQELMVPILSKL